MTLTIELKPTLYEQVVNFLSQFKDIKIIDNDEKELVSKKGRELDKLYLDFLEEKSKGKLHSIETDEDFENHIKELEKCIN